MNVSNLRCGTTALLIAAAAVAQNPQVLRDLDATPVDQLGSRPGEFVEHNGQVVFAATTAADGRELWTLDPTTGQSSMLLDIAAGPASGAPHSLVAFGGFVYFVADDGVHGSEIWRTDGTAGGTQMFLDLVADGSAFPAELTVAGGRLFFSAYVDGLGNELVVTDGSLAGTQALEIVPGPEHAWPSGLTAVGGDVWCRAFTGATGFELFRSDGTPAGTGLAAEVVPGPGDGMPERIRPLGPGAVAFLADGQAWRSDGTQAGTGAFATGTQLATVGATAYVGDGTSLLRSDGTVAGTSFVGTLPLQYFGSITGLTPLATGVIVHASQLVLFSFEARTFTFDVVPGALVELPRTIVPATAAVDGGVAWFASHEDGSFGGSEIWRTDGTIAGTTQQLSIQPGSTAHPADLRWLAASQRLVFSAVDTFGREPWAFDPAQGSGQRLANLTDDNGATDDSFPHGFVDAAGTGYFVGHVGPASGVQLLGTDGTEAGTVALPMAPGQPAGASELLTVGTRVVFRTYEPLLGTRLWVRDGVGGVTTQLDVQGQVQSGHFVVAEDLLYFTVDDAFQRENLWRTDGTQAGTFQVVERPEFGVWNDIAALGRGVVFSYSTYANGVEPYYNDGTPTGTVMLADLEPGAGHSGPRQLTSLGERCLFVAFNNRLFVTDGTPAGTGEVMPGVVFDDIEELTATRDRVWFAAEWPTGGAGLWSTDGTAAGTTSIAQIATTSGYNVIGITYPFGDQLLFKVWVGNQLHLWRSDGTATGTYRLVGGSVGNVLPAGERYAYFTTFDPAHGSEVWRTDGTIAGTRLHADLVPGPSSSSPVSYALSGGRLLFSAVHPQLGNEPWVLQLPATSQDVGYGCTITTRVPPQLWSDDPVLGTTMQVRVGHGPDPGISALMFSNYTSQVWPLGSGLCDYFVDPGLLILDLAVMPGGLGSHQLALPNAPSLVHQRFRMQALTLPAAGLLAAELSNGLSLTLGY